MSKQTNETRVDELDWEIVNKLTLNGRTSFNKIAHEIGTSTDTVVKRYHKLKEKGVIKVSIQINLNRLGYQALLDFNIASISSLSLSGITESLESIPDVVVITKTSGDYDLQVTAAVRDVEQMFALQEEIAKVPGITKIRDKRKKNSRRLADTAATYFNILGECKLLGNQRQQLKDFFQIESAPSYFGAAK